MVLNRELTSRAWLNKQATGRKAPIDNQVLAFEGPNHGLEVFKNLKLSTGQNVSLC